MSAAVQGQLAPSRNATIAKAETDDRERALNWTSSSSVSSTGQLPHTTSEASILPHRSNGMINKDDLINSNPLATAAGNTSGSKIGSSAANVARAIPSREQSSDSADKPNSSDEINAKAGGESKKQARRRKANRACSHCQKAHLTCDDSRPCERCVKKGLADTCTDGARKKAKYLLDEDEILELKREKERKKRDGHASIEPATTLVKAEPIEQTGRVANSSDWAHKLDVAQSSPSHQVSFGDATTIAPASLSETPQSVTAVKEGTGTPSAHHNSETDLYTTISSFSPTSSSGLNHAFGSETTSLEYSILSSMLNGIDPAWLSGSPDGQGTDTDLGRVIDATSSAAGPFSHMGIDGMPWQFAHEESSPWRGSSGGKDSQVEPLHHMDSTISSGTNATDGLAAYDALEVPSPQGTASSALDVNGRSGPLTSQPESAAGASARLAQNAQSGKRAAAAAAAAAGQDKKPDAVWKERVKHIYSDKMKPFPYTEGYHSLIKYVTANLEKAQVLRIVRALAIFRPSLIALQMPLSEEDEIFVERSIQRTILEFEKLISFSGTPTVVWRRTCEIVVVGAEFSMLTQWSKEYLSGRYIYEFFDKPSILDYWERFALHAFENTAQSIMMQLTLKTSTGNTVKCAACFSIKRDVFDLPSLIVGNFLPILS